ncbi:dihydropteroate synthase [Rapidithrix thailandica]|uniref:dihydropteroate synthase n=1 Tax=Rapidithrix thailandica TaxID=413964 RepID=A0AAW9SBE0_9BACT
MNSIQIKGQLVDFTVPKIMGIINITSDSFYKESRVMDEHFLLQRATRMLEEGADFLDIGGYSSRPGAIEVPEEEESRRVTQAIQALKKEHPEALISVDTFRAKVAKAAVEAGADLINDISGGELDATMFDVVAASGVPYILMHMRGNPQNMQQLTQYENLLEEIIDYFQQKLVQLQALGCTDIIVDPGFGFAKSVEQNYELLNQLPALKILDRPVLVGLSRKSMIYKKLNILPEEALNGTSILNTLAVKQGAAILRVHDVKEAKQIVQLLY